MALQHLVADLNVHSLFHYTFFSSLVLFLTLILYRIWLHPLRYIPGPLPARITELWRTWRYFNGTWHMDILGLHQRYGSVVRIAPNEVSVVHPDLARTVYSYQKGTEKTSWYDTWKALGGSKSNNTANSFFNTTDMKEHAFLRKRVSALYSMSYVVALDDKVQPIMDTLFDRFEVMAEARTAINLSHWTSLFTYDVVWKLCLGQTMGFIRDGQDSNKFIQAVHDAFYWIANMGYLPGQAFIMMHPVIIRAGQLLGLRGTNFSTAFGKMSIEQVLKRKNEDQEGRKKKMETDMLDHFLAMKDPQGEPASMFAIMAEIGNLLAAGADTTSVAIKAVLGPVLQDKARYKRLQAELDEARSKESSGIPAYSTTKDLPFLTACIKEGFRMHPSIVYQLPRKAPFNGISFDGYFIPPSATISMSPISQNRCKAVFGQDADDWKPERWIPGEGNSEDSIKVMERNLASFGYGSRTCIGLNLATFEVYKFVSQFLLRFDVELVCPERPWTIRSL